MNEYCGASTPSSVYSDIRHETVKFFCFRSRSMIQVVASSRSRLDRGSDRSRDIYRDLMIPILRVRSYEYDFGSLPKMGQIISFRLWAVIKKIAKYQVRQSVMTMSHLGGGRSHSDMNMSLDDVPLRESKGDRHSPYGGGPASGDDSNRDRRIFVSHIPFRYNWRDLKDEIRKSEWRYLYNSCCIVYR